MRATCIIVAATAALLTGNPAGSLLAHDGATGIVAERMATMQNMELQLRTIQAMLSGWAPFDLAKLREYVAVLHDNCHRSGSLFPPGSSDRASHAKPAVWDDPEAFQEEFRKLHEASEALVEIVGDGDRTDIATATSDLQRACDGCHATFRKPITRVH
jgi:cytochrome c556